MNNFSELTLNPTIHLNLTRNNFREPTPVQAQSLLPGLEGSDLVATAQTGTGKTLAFAIPIAQKILTAAPDNKRAIQALILAPTRELALQIADTFSKIAAGTPLKSAVVVGGLSESTQLSAIRRGVQLVIATPGRLEDFLGRNLIDLSAVQTVVLDEADRMLDMGFLPAIERILATLPKNRQSLFFSATMNRTVERLINGYSRNPVRIEVGGPTAKPAEQVDLHVYEVRSDKRVELLHHMLHQDAGSFLVFAKTKHGTDRLAKNLSALGVRAAVMHGGRSQNQRNQALAGFRDGRYRVLVATDVVARGIHVDGVAHVVNFDLPQAPQDFIHRVGRTGRAGQRGSASTFISKGERGEITRIERECKVRMIRREVSPEMVAAVAEVPNANLFEDRDRESAPPSFRRSRKPASSHTSRGPSARRNPRFAR